MSRHVGLAEDEDALTVHLSVWAQQPAVTEGSELAEMMARAYGDKKTGDE